MPVSLLGWHLTEGSAGFSLLAPSALKRARQPWLPSVPSFHLVPFPLGASPCPHPHQVEALLLDSWTEVAVRTGALLVGLSGLLSVSSAAVLEVITLVVTTLLSLFHIPDSHWICLSSRHLSRSWLLCPTHFRQTNQCPFFFQEWRLAHMPSTVTTSCRRQP